MTTDVEREAFEAWLSSLKFVSGQGQAHVEYCLHRDLSDKYTTEWVSDMYQGWQARAAWQRAQSAPVVPDGWRLVPVAPTEEMWNAGCKWTSFKQQALDIYRAMLAAAPAQPAARGEFGDAYQGAREDLAIWKRRALEAEEKLRKAEQSTPAAIEVIGYASPGQVEIVRSLPRTGGMKVKGCKDGRYTEPVVLLSAARAALFAAVIRCEQAGAFKTCMECGYQDGHDEICKFHDSNRAAHDQGEVQSK